MDKDWKAPEPEQPFEKFHFQQEDSIDSEDEPVPDDPFVNGVYKLMELMTYTMITHFEDSVKSVTYEEIMDLLNKNQKLIPSDVFMRLKQYAEKKQQDMIQANIKAQAAEQKLSKLRKDYYKELEYLRQQVIRKKEEKAAFEYVEVRYFDVTDGLPDDVIELLNARLEQTKNSYNLLLNDL